MNGGDLKQWRKNSGLTQAKAAKYLFIPLTTYQNYEQGHRTIPDAVAARTQSTPSGAPRDAKPRHERRPYPNEDLRQYMLPEADDSKAKTMDRYVEAWGGWFTIQYHTVGGWHPTLYRGNCETVYAEPRPGEHKDPQMPLHMLPTSITSSPSKQPCPWPARTTGARPMSITRPTTPGFSGK